MLAMAPCSPHVFAAHGAAVATAYRVVTAKKNAAMDAVAAAHAVVGSPTAPMKVDVLWGRCSPSGRCNP